MTRDRERLQVEIDPLLENAHRTDDEQGPRQPIPHTADSGDFSEANTQEVTALGLDPHYATGRQKHHAPEGTAPATTETAKEALSRKLRAEPGRLVYAARKHIVEPVFGQIKRVRGFRKFSQRGLKLISAECQLLCATHNLLKIWRFTFRSG